VWSYVHNWAQLSERFVPFCQIEVSRGGLSRFIALTNLFTLVGKVVYKLKNLYLILKFKSLHYVM
jgi:hypothetical protein